MRIPYLSLAFSSTIIFLSMAILLKLELVERPTLLNASAALYVVSLISFMLSIREINSMLDISVGEFEEVKYRILRNLVVLIFSLATLLFAYSLTSSLLPASLFPRLLPG